MSDVDESSISHLFACHISSDALATSTTCDDAIDRVNNAADVATIDANDDDDCRVRGTFVDVVMVREMEIYDGNAICARIDWLCAMASLIEICARAGELYRAI